MSKRLQRGSRRSLTSVLDVPGLARAVPHLAPELLHRLIRHAGTETSVDLLAAATPAQLTAVFDLDLWEVVRPGDDEQFDADRFGEWLEALAETAGQVGSRILAAMNERLLIAGLSRYIKVFDPAALSVTTMDGTVIEYHLTSDDGVECEVGGYLIQAVRGDAWDAVVALLIALEAGHPDVFHAVMRGCRRLSTSASEDDGLDALLMEPQQLFHNIAAERDLRRSQQGYSTTADARAFLAMARLPRERRAGEPTVNPIAAEYRRNVSAPVATEPHRPSHGMSSPLLADSRAEALGAVIDGLADAGLLPRQPRALVRGDGSRPSRLSCIHTLMDHVRDRDAVAYNARGRELAFLANTLVAGCSVQGRPFSPSEASGAAVATCNLGLEHWGADRRHSHATREFASVPPTGLLLEHDLIAAFEVGWAVLHEQVSLYVARELVGVLATLRNHDAEVLDGLRALRRVLTKQCEAGAPWLAFDALDVVAILDVPAWASLVGLLGECPVIPAAVQATLAGRAGAVSATAFEFVSTVGQIATIRDFVAALPDRLRP